MKQNWSDVETYRKRGQKINDPIISIHSSRVFKLSSSFIHHAKAEIADKTHVVLSFSKENNAVIFRFTQKTDELGEMNLNVNSGYLISARPFFNYFGLDAEKCKGKYKAVLKDLPSIGKVWVIYLNKRYK